MFRSILVWCFQIREPTRLKLFWVALTLLNIGLMLTLAWRSRWPFRTYLVCAALSSLLRSSPLWRTPYDFILVASAVGFGWSLLPRGRRAVVAIGIGIMLLGVLILAAPMDWPAYSPTRYHARLSAAVLLMTVAAACVVDRWTRGEPANWMSVIAIPWFLTWFLSLVQWRDDPQNQGYWVVYWNVAVAAKAAWTACLLAWLISGATSKSHLFDPVADVKPQTRRTYPDGRHPADT